jgi:hypothetical protein
VSLPVLDLQRSPQSAGLLSRSSPLAAVCHEDVNLTTGRWLNNQVEQDHRQNKAFFGVASGWNFLKEIAGYWQWLLATLQQNQKCVAGHTAEYPAST